MTERHRWDLPALLFFGALLILCAYCVYRFGELWRLYDFGTFDFAVVSLAAFRLIHLFTYDKIFAFVREYIDHKGKTDDRTGIYRYIDSFLECLWCTGIWSALISLTLYVLNIWGAYVVLFLAIAGVASLMQLVSKAIYHYTEM